MNDINFSFNTTSNQNAQKNKREERAIKIGKDTRASLLMKRRENFIQACSSPFLIFTVNRVRTAPLLLSCLLSPLPAQLWYRFFIKLSDSFSSKITLIRWWMEMTKKSSRLPRCSDDSCPRVCRSSVWTMSRCQSSKYLCHCHWCSLLLCRILKERQQHASAVRSRLGFVQYCFWLIWWYIFFSHFFFLSFLHLFTPMPWSRLEPSTSSFASWILPPSRFKNKPFGVWQILLVIPAIIRIVTTFLVVVSWINYFSFWMMYALLSLLIPLGSKQALTCLHRRLVSLQPLSRS